MANPGQRRKRNFPQDPFSHEFTWDIDEAEPSDSGDDDDDNEFDEGEHAGNELVETLVSLYFDGKLSAKWVCVICWFASKAGAQGPAARVALKPTAQSGQFARKLDAYLGIDVRKRDLLHVQVPGYTKADVSRSTSSVPVRAPHEEIDKEVQRDPIFFADLDNLVRDSEWGPAYTQHLVVQGSTERVVPVVLYVDGFPFSQLDGAIGFYIYSLVSGFRHLAAILRKSEICRCGCKGWCSIFPILLFLTWSFAAGAAGLFPARRWDGAEWGDDVLRAAKAGQRLRSKLALVHIKGDWLEYATTFGYASWKSLRHPCLFCNCNNDNMYSIDNFSAVSSLWTLKGLADYEAACAACELHAVVALQDDLERIVANLRYDKREHGNHGRCLTAPIHKFGLRIGDRLEPTPTLQDVGALCASTVLPIALVFWRTANERGVKHRVPLMKASLGVSMGTFAIDQLHVLNLGVFKDYVTFVFWALLTNNVFGLGLMHTPAERISLGVLHLRHVLFAWYTQSALSNPDETIHKMKNLTEKMLGSRAKPKLRVKAAESKSLLFFAADMAEQFKGSIPHGRELAGAGQALAKYMTICNVNGRKLRNSVVQERYSQLIDTCLECVLIFVCELSRRTECQQHVAQELVDCYRRFVLLAKAAGMEPKPKQHMMGHLTQRRPSLQA